MGSHIHTIERVTNIQSDLELQDIQGSDRQSADTHYIYTE